MHGITAQSDGRRNPWLITTVILGVVVLGLFAQSMLLIGILVGENGAANFGKGQTGQDPTAQNIIEQPSVPTAPVSVSADDDPFLGNADAPVTLIEFNDFQCPFCRRHYTATAPQIKSEYVDTGKIRYVTRDFPLSFHPMAPVYAEASQCANDLGKFWQMHDKIFDEQNKKGQGTISDYTEDDVKRWAVEIGLNAQQFDNCLDSGKYSQEVQKDFSDGTAAGVTGTPSFFVCKGSDCQMIVGAQPFAAFKQAIDQKL